MVLSSRLQAAAPILQYTTSSNVFAHPPVLYSVHTRGVGSSWGRITSAAITSTELVIEPPGLFGG